MHHMQHLVGDRGTHSCLCGLARPITALSRENSGPDLAQPLTRRSPAAAVATPAAAEATPSPGGCWSQKSAPVGVSNVCSGFRLRSAAEGERAAETDGIDPADWHEYAETQAQVRE